MKRRRKDIRQLDSGDESCEIHKFILSRSLPFVLCREKCFDTTSSYVSTSSEGNEGGKEEAEVRERGEREKDICRYWIPRSLFALFAPQLLSSSFLHLLLRRLFFLENMPE